jgi:hypothetical protein
MPPLDTPLSPTLMQIIFSFDIFAFADVFRLMPSAAMPADSQRRRVFFVFRQL